MDEGFSFVCAKVLSRLENPFDMDVWPTALNARHYFFVLATSVSDVAGSASRITVALQNRLVWHYDEVNILIETKGTAAVDVEGVCDVSCVLSCLPQKCCKTTRQGVIAVVPLREIDCCCCGCVVVAGIHH